MKKIGFAGLGSMGSAIANNLLESGLTLKIYNRTTAKAEPLLAKGAQLAKRPAELLDEPGAIVISMLANDQAVESIVFGEHGLEQSLTKDSIHISMSTLSPELGKRLTAHHEKLGAHFIAAPVFGLPPAAAARKLFICLAGHPQAKALIEPILHHLSQKIFDFGDEPEAALVMKLIGNFLILSASQSMAEGFSLGKKYGLDPTVMLAMLTQSLFPSYVYEGYGKRVIEQRFDPALFKLQLGLKDLTLLSKAAEDVHSIMPIASLIKQGLVTANDMGRGNLDWSSLALFISEGNSEAFKNSNLQIQIIKGKEALPYIDDLVALRCSYFKEDPYRYDADRSFEKNYINTYMQSDHSLFAIAKINNRVVGFLSGKPFSEVAIAHQKPFLDAALPIESIFYMGELVLEKSYASISLQQEMAHQFEKHLQAVGKYHQMALYEIIQSKEALDPFPESFSIEHFWQKTGFVKRPALILQMDWKEIGQSKETPHTLMAWTKEL